MNTDDVSRDLARAFPAAPGDLSRLRDRLAADSQRDGILDVAYRIVDSPVGPLLLAATEQGLVRVAYAREDHDAVLQALANKVSPRILHAPARLDLSARELEEYFAGSRHAFDLPLDWRLSAGFRRTVLSHLPEIGYGHTAAGCAQLASRLTGQPGWTPGRTFGFASVATPDLLALTPPGALAGMTGATAAGGSWRIGQGLLLVNDDPGGATP